MTLKIKPGFWPTQSQKLLIVSALGEKDDAVDAWREWCKSNDLESIDNGSYRLLPLVYKNIGAHIKSDKYWINLKEIYFNFWELNEKLAHATKEIIAELFNGGMEVVLLKGFPLVKNYYIDSALRPMGDIDILVPKEYFHRAFNILNDSGWKHSFQEEQFEIIAKYFHAVDFSNNLNYHLDLHWQIIPGMDKEEFNYISWVDSTKHFSVPVKTLTPTDELFHNCVHGAQWNRIPSIRWIIDAYQIIKIKGTDIDWMRLLKLAKKNSSILQITAAFQLLDNLFENIIPSEVMIKLSNIKPTIPKKIRYLLISQPIPVIWGFADKIFYFHRMNKIGVNIEGITNFISYVKLSWGLNRSDHIFIFIFKMIFQRIRLDVFTSPYFKRKHKELDLLNKKDIE